MRPRSSVASVRRCHDTARDEDRVLEELQLDLVALLPHHARVKAAEAIDIEGHDRPHRERLGKADLRAAGADVQHGTLTFLRAIDQPAGIDDAVARSIATVAHILRLRTRIPEGQSVILL